MSTEVVHNAHCPVGVVHSDPTSELQSAQSPVVVGVDGSPTSDLAVGIAFEEASWRDADLVAVHAWTDGDVTEILGGRWPTIQPSVEEALADLLAGWVERYPGFRCAAWRFWTIRHSTSLSCPNCPAGRRRQPRPRGLRPDDAGLSQHSCDPRRAHTGHRCASEITETGADVLGAKHTC